MPFAIYQQKRLDYLPLSFQQRRKKFLCRTITYTAFFLSLALTFLVLFVTDEQQFFFILMLTFFLYAGYELILILSILCSSNSFQSSDTLVVKTAPIHYVELSCANVTLSNSYNHVYPANYNYHPKSYGYFDQTAKTTKIVQISPEGTFPCFDGPKYYQ